MGLDLQFEGGLRESEGSVLAWSVVHKLFCLSSFLFLIHPLILISGKMS